jgi:hypothetical protein
VVGQAGGATRAPTGRQWVCIGALALAGASFVLLATHDGVPITGDDAVYVGVARSVAAGHGLNVPIHYYPLGKVSIGTPPPGSSSPSPTPLVVYAPLEPILLAAGGQHPVGAARVEDTIFFGLTILLVGWFVLTVTGELWLAAASQLVIGLSLAKAVSAAGTIASALFLVTVALMAVIRYRASPRWGLLALACGAIGLATVDRFAAGGLIVWGALALSRRPRAALVLLVGSSLPLAGWFIYEGVSGRSTGHFLGFHVVKTTIRTGIHSIGFWILPVGSSTGLVVLGTLVVAAIVLVVLLRGRGPEPLLLIGFAIVQVVILEVATTFVDAGVDLDSREFVPIYLAVVMAVACGVARADWTKAVAVAAVAAVAASALRFGIDTTTTPPGAYTTPAWNHSPIVAAVRALPRRAVIYTDAPDVLYMLDGRATSSIPETQDFSTLKDNGRFEAQITEIEQTLLARGGYVVFVRGLGRSSFLPGETTLRRLLDLRPVNQVRDGAVYTIARS